MTRVTAKSRLNSHLREIRQDFGHQVALPDDLCCMENYTTIARFCTQYALDHRTMSVTAKWPNGKEDKYRLHCFRTPEAAKLFADHFSGTPFDPVRAGDAGASPPRSRRGIRIRV